MNKRLLVPFFLQKLDEKLLRNKPNTWAARTHLVIWFVVLFSLALSLFCYLAFFDAKQYNSIGGWVTFVSLIVFIGFVFWMIFLLRFNVFKRYGNWFAWDGLKSFALYFISIGAMVAVCFLPSAVQTFRANQQFGNDEVINDINEINVDACKLEYDQLPLQWKVDTCKVIDKNSKDSQNNIVGDTVVDGTIRNKQLYHLIDTADLSTKLFQADSIVKITDSLYAFFECPDYTFVSSYNADEYTSLKTFRSKDIYYKVIKNYAKPDRAPLLKRMDELNAKYAADSRYGYYDGYDDYNSNDTYSTKITKKYKLRRVGNGLDNVVEKKYAWISNWHSYLRTFYYITMALTLLVFMFRHSTTKTFFLSLLAAIILIIFTGLIMVMSNGSESTIFSFMIVYYVAFAILALSINGASVRNAIQGIGLNLFLFMTPFVPLIFVGLNKAINQARYYDSIYNKPEVDHTALYVLIAEIAGGIILLILLEPLFRRLYRKWFAAPEN